MLRTRLIAGPTSGLILSLVFASGMLLVHSFETLLEPLRVDPDHPAPVTLRLPPMTIPVTEQGESTFRFDTVVFSVGRGEVVRDPFWAAVVRTYERLRRPPQLTNLVGIWFIYFLIANMLATYLRTFSPSPGSLLRTQVGIFALLFAFLLGVKGFLLLSRQSQFLLPASILPLWVALHLDRRTAFIVSIVTSFFLAALVGFRLTAIAVYLAAAVSALFFFRNRKHSRTLLTAGLASGTSAVLVLVVAATLFEKGIDLREDLRLPLRSNLLSAFVGGAAGGLLAYWMQNSAEIFLGVVSRPRLLDLADLDHPLLQKMAREAPGSWEHSRAMANLAEAAAAAIGADALLTRVGAYYHDLGKTCQPKYFVENLQPGETTPHEALEPEVSADAIMAHVVEGTRILRRGGIPEPVIEFAYTHHGTSVIEYFWHKCLERGNPHQLDENFFRYPGMRPRNKETAILMLVDSIEAAARTIDEPSREAFEEMILRVVFVKLRQGQLDESGLTIEDIRVLVNRLADTLCSVYHHRIKYPWQSRAERGESQLPMPGVATEEDVARALEQRQSEHDALRGPVAENDAGEGDDRNVAGAQAQADSSTDSQAAPAEDTNQDPKDGRPEAGAGPKEET